MSARGKAAKTVTATIKLLIPAAGAKPAPPVGPALGQAGLNIMSFCKDFNAKTSEINAGTPIPVVITAFSDKTFTFTTKTPPVTHFIKQAAGLEKGSQRPGHAGAGEISPKAIFEIAQVKQADTPHIPLEHICSSIAGTCRSMGIKVASRTPAAAAAPAAEA
eukprot:jgi/Astpho2/251/e_gw1.00010.190.1_t